MRSTSSKLCHLDLDVSRYLDCSLRHHRSHCDVTCVLRRYCRDRVTFGSEKNVGTQSARLSSKQCLREQCSCLRLRLTQQRSSLAQAQERVESLQQQRADSSRKHENGGHRGHNAAPKDVQQEAAGRRQVPVHRSQPAGQSWLAPALALAVVRASRRCACVAEGGGRIERIAK